MVGDLVRLVEVYEWQVSQLGDLTALLSQPFLKGDESSAHGWFTANPSNVNQFQDVLKSIGYTVSSRDRDAILFTRTGQPDVLVSFDDARTRATVSIERHSLPRT